MQGHLSQKLFHHGWEEKGTGYVGHHLSSCLLLCVQRRHYSWDVGVLYVSLPLLPVSEPQVRCLGRGLHFCNCSASCGCSCHWSWRAGVTYVALLLSISFFWARGGWLSCHSQLSRILGSASTVPSFSLLYVLNPSSFAHSEVWNFLEF